MISTILIPATQTASAACMACLAEVARTTGMMPTWRCVCDTLLLSCDWPVRSQLSRDASPRALHDLLNFFQSCHGGISRGGHGQRAMSRSAFHRPLRTLAGEKAIDQYPRRRSLRRPRGRRSPDSPASGLIECPVLIADGAPIVQRGGLGFAQSCGHHPKGKLLRRRFQSFS